MIDNLNQVLEESVSQLEEAFVSFPWENEDAYCLYLAQAYYYVTHSTKLLEYAAQSASGELKECFLHHIEEENGHELLALNDFKKFGRKIEDYPAYKETTQLYDTIYEGIDNHGPAAIVGYALALEGLSAKQCPNIAKRLIETYGMSKSTFIKLHGDVDPGHMEESQEVLKLIDEKDYPIICDYIKESAKRYIDFLNLMSAQVLSKAS